MVKAKEYQKKARTEFGKKLKAWREKNEWSQQKLAVEIGCSIGLIYKWENEQRYPTDLGLKIELQKVTGINVDDIERKHFKKTGGE